MGEKMKKMEKMGDKENGGQPPLFLEIANDTMDLCHAMQELM